MESPKDAEVPDQEFPPQWITLLDSLPLKERAEAYGVCTESLRQVERWLAEAREEREEAMRTLHDLNNEFQNQVRRKFRRYLPTIKRMERRMNREMELIEKFYKHHDRSKYEHSYMYDRRWYFKLPDWYLFLLTLWINGFRRLRACYHKCRREELRSCIASCHRPVHRRIEKLAAKPELPREYLKYCSHSFWFHRSPGEDALDKNYFGYRISAISTDKLLGQIDWFLREGESSLKDSLWMGNPLILECRNARRVFEYNRVPGLQEKLKLKQRQLQSATDAARDRKIELILEQRIDEASRQLEKLREHHRQVEDELRRNADQEFEGWKKHCEEESAALIGELQLRLNGMTNKGIH